MRPIDLILTTHNRVDLFEKTINSLDANTNWDLVHQFIIADDCSTDGTVNFAEQVARQDSRFLFVPSPKRRGLVPTFNNAFSYCETEFVCEVQDDVTFAPGWLDLQLAAIKRHISNRLQFVTGYDAPEHDTFRQFRKWKIKPSSRFTQLLSLRSTWDKWFPMKPWCDFPTPCRVGNKRYGSNIDCNLYLHRKNKWSSGVQFLVMPDLIHHAGEEPHTSTWRNV